MQTVYVGLSGGVDSAVSAALLIKERGFNVVGAFIKIWRPEFLECTWKEDRLDAMRVAAALGIPFREIDLSEEYKKEVVDSMVRDYAKGITPNPDVLCNKEIKFGSFLRWARAEGADMVATGHYARIEYNDIVSRYSLCRGVDRAKDQSYFLHQLKGEDLAHILFPIGDLQKSEVRDLARRFKLPVATRPDSQGLCFVGDVTMSEFLSRFIPQKPGPVVDRDGKTVGKHDGASLYTIGQRHGFTVAQSGSPYYVTRVDPSTNTVFVSHLREDGAVRIVRVAEMHLIDGSRGLPRHVFAQARYREASVPVTVSERSGIWSVSFETPHIAAPGQSLVLYDDDRASSGEVKETSGRLIPSVLARGLRPAGRTCDHCLGGGSIS